MISDVLSGTSDLGLPVSQTAIHFRLTRKRRRHILTRHPELEDQKDRVLETLTSPDMIQEGDFGTLLCAKLYMKHRSR